MSKKKPVKVTIEIEYVENKGIKVNMIATDADGQRLSSETVDDLLSDRQALVEDNPALMVGIMCLQYATAVFRHEGDAPGSHDCTDCGMCSPEELPEDISGLN